MRPVTVSVGPLATASANAIALTQTPTTGPLTLNGALATGGVANLVTPRQVLITTTGNESSRTFTITGTNWSGSPITETVTGPNIGTVASKLSYLTVNSITISGNAAAALTVGTNALADSQWVYFDTWANAQTAIQCTLTGTANYTVQFSMQDPNSPTDPVTPSAMVWLNSLDPNVVAASTSQSSYFPNTPIWAKVTLNSGTGSVSSVFSQFSVAPY